MKKPFFSVIIPAYNRAPFFKIAVESILSQSFDNFELIIIDDGSEDNTYEIVNEFNDRRIKYFYQKHRGVSLARNKGIKEAKGEFISFLDSDDRFRIRKLEMTYNFIIQHPQYHIFHTEEIWYRNGKLLPQKIYHKKPHNFVFKEALKKCCISISTASVRKSIFSEAGFFDENLPVCEDYDFWLRVTYRFPVFLIPIPLTIKEGGRADQQSKKYICLDKFRIYALKKILEDARLDKENYLMALKELKNKCSIYIKGALKRNKLGEVNYYKSLIYKFESEKAYA